MYEKIRSAGADYEAGEVDIRTWNLWNNRGISDKDIGQAVDPAASIHYVAGLRCR